MGEASPRPVTEAGRLFSRTVVGHAPCLDPQRRRHPLGLVTTSIDARKRRPEIIAATHEN